MVTWADLGAILGLFPGAIAVVIGALMYLAGGQSSGDSQAADSFARWGCLTFVTGVAILIACAWALWS